jgi:hypothetical protein
VLPDSPALTLNPVPILIPSGPRYTPALSSSSKNVLLPEVRLSVDILNPPIFPEVAYTSPSSVTPKLVPTDNPQSDVYVLLTVALLPCGVIQTLFARTQLSLSNSPVSKVSGIIIQPLSK